MSVYTVVNHDQLVTHLQQYPLGDLISFQGISSGIENTNYFVTTTTGEYVLTLFEELKAEELPYFLKLMVCVSDSCVPSARPIADNHHNLLTTLNGKPAAFVEKLEGSDIEEPNTIQCSVLGRTMAQLHLAVKPLDSYQENSRGAVWRQQAAELLIPLVDKESADIIQDELKIQSSYNHLDIPKGIIHADLFRDNALFSGDELSGIIDFYYACNDYWMYDIAVAVNDWCIGDGGLLDRTLFEAFIEAYQTIRPFTAEEISHWPVIIRAAAFRFWLSRLRDVHFPKEGEMTHLKKPDAMKTILIARRNTPDNYDLG
ncbi:MAG: homoserine kinase [Piscirickettsiaceae bacterium]|nr:MAG: homoserine kinase [Piscirickettsiaceae bacterium]